MSDNLSHSRLENPHLSGAGFTLLEVMLAVVLTMLVVGAVMGLVSVGVAGSAWIEQEEDRGRSVDAVLDYLESGLMETVGRQELEIWSVNGAQAEGWQDQLGWIAPDGDAAFSTDHTQAFEVIVGVREEPTGPVLGLASREQSDLNGQFQWIPLLEGVDAFNLEFFDPRLNSYVEQWPKGNPQPALVRMTVRFQQDGLTRTRLVKLPELQAAPSGGGRQRGRDGGGGNPGGNPAPAEGQNPAPAPSPEQGGRQR